MTLLAVNRLLEWSASHSMSANQLRLVSQLALLGPMTGLLASRRLGITDAAVSKIGEELVKLGLVAKKYVTGSGYRHFVLTQKAVDQLRETGIIDVVPHDRYCPSVPYVTTT